MKKIISSIICIVGVLIFTQCMVDKTFIDEAEIAWFQCYDNGDTLIFRSEGNKQIYVLVDTIFVDNPNNNNPFDWEGMSFTHYFEIGNDIVGTGHINLVLIGGPINEIGQSYSRWAKLSIKDPRSAWYNGYRIAVGDLYCLDRGEFIKALKDSAKYSDCQFRASDYMKEKDSNDSITDFVWSRERGLLSFTVRDTATYHLVERIPRNLE